MELVEFVRSQGEAALTMIDHSMADLDDEIVHWRPGGTANTIAQLLAHLLSGQDLLITDKIGGGKSLHESGWAARTGIPLDRTQIWQQGAWRLNLDAFDEYRQAVEANSRKYLNSLTLEELGREYLWVRGPQQAALRLLQVIFINHALGHCGEISALKGIRGLKGLPI